MEHLNSRLKKVITEILSFKEPVTSEYLAKVIGVTSRTIRNDIKALNLELKKIGVEIEAIRGVGYFFDPKQKEQVSELIQELFLHEEEDSKTPVLPEERVLFILKKIIMAEGFITIEQLANDLFVSKSTVDNDLKRVEQLLNRYDIDLFKKPNYGIKMIGNEMNIRFCLSDSLAKMNEVHYQSEMSLVDYEFVFDEDIEDISKITQERVKVLPFSMADLPLNNLVIHIAIAIERIQKGKNVAVDVIELKEIVDTKEYKVAKEIVKSLEDRFNITIPLGEISYITIHLLGAKHFEDQHGVQTTEFIEVIGESKYELVIDILSEIKVSYQIDLLEDQELIYGLGLHLRSAINRISYQMNLRNPMLQQIKRNYPFSFELGIVAAEVIQKKKNLVVNEDEIGYIALHLEAAVGRMENQKRREVRRIAIVCASGIGTAKLLEASIKSELPGLEIVGTYPSYSLKHMNHEEVDLILSTIPVQDSGSIPALHINPILTKKDMEKIKEFVSGQSANSVVDSLVFRLEKLFNDQLFFPSLKGGDSTDIIRLMSRKLYEMGYVDESFEESVLEREDISPTALGNLVAIPHPLNPNAKGSCIAIGVLEKPISWGEQSVQLVFLLALNKNEKEEFSQLFSHLWEIVQNKRLVDELCSIGEFSLFMEQFFGGTECT
jgi:lichenan operon transcriptional antiterminator